MLCPWRKIPQLAIVAVISQPHLRANEQNLPIVDDDPAIVYHILVYHGPNSDLVTSGTSFRDAEHIDPHSDVTHNVHSFFRSKNLC